MVVITGWEGGGSLNFGEPSSLIVIIGALPSSYAYDNV